MRLRTVAGGLVLLTALTLFNSTAHAHVSVIFEYAPDAWGSQRFALNSVSGAVYQLFTAPTTASVSGIDLWLDNVDDPGAITFIFFDEQMHELVQANGTVPHLAKIAGGTKAHFDIPGSVGVIAGKSYAMQIYCLLPDLGIYSANRITLLEHNQAIPDTYINGSARINQAVQDFTFKFALHAPVAQSSFNTDPSTSTTSSTPLVQIAITNARVTTSTPSSATVAWTTNVATDSRVAIRTQINPLYVIASNSDQTLELEHTVTVSGLIPNVNYFADVFSSQGDALVLTTYTIAFKTPDGVVTPNQPTTPTTPTTASSTTSTTNTTPNSNPSTNTNTSNTNSGASNAGTTNNNPGTNGGSSNTNANNQTQGASTPNGSSNSQASQNGALNNGGATGSSGGATNQTGLTIAPGDDSNSTRISWPTSGGSAYRIDVFDANHDLERSINVPAGATSKEVAGLLSGTHHVIVYEVKSDGSFVKVAPAETIVVTRNNATQRVIIGGVILLLIAAGGGFAIWRFKHENSVLPPEEGYNPEAF